MSKTPLMRLLRRAVRSSAADTSRRAFLRNTMLAGAALSVPPLISSCSRPRDLVVARGSNVVVIGAGLSGLVAARDLIRNNVDVSLYEAATRTGGRVLSVNEFLVKGAVTELGGEFVDSVHADVLALANEYDLDLIDLQAEPFVSLSDSFLFDGTRIEESDIVREISPFLKKIEVDIDRLPLALIDLANSPAQALDAMSMEAYFAHVGFTGWLRSFLETAFVTENGLELGEQSAMNFILTIGTELRSGAFRLYGESDERFKIRGGNQQITDRLAGELGEHIHLGHRLERIGKVGERYVLSFRYGSSTTEVLADAVICTVPFSVLRNVQLDVDLPHPLENMINDLHYGENAKTLVGFDRPFWHDVQASGVVYTDLPIQLAWDNTAEQNVQGAGLTLYSGGSTCRMLMAMKKSEAQTVLMDALRGIWPQSAAEPHRRFERMNWPQSPFVKASYSSFGPGQWSAFYGVAAPSGNDTLVFAGEHTDDEFRGYMNGAARSGRRAASHILSVLHA